MSSANVNRPISAKPMTQGEAMVFAFAFTELADVAATHLTERDMATLLAIHSRVTTELHLILTGEIEDKSSETLPSLTFLRHCGTPLADRYFKEMGLAILDTFGVQTHARFRDALGAQLINS